MRTKLKKGEEIRDLSSSKGDSMRGLVGEAPPSSLCYPFQPESRFYVALKFKSFYPVFYKPELIELQMII